MSDQEDGELDDEMREFMDAAMVEPHFPQNLFLNILAGDGIIFQYDHPYDSDDDDYDYLYDYDDEDLFNDEVDDDNSRKIFVTLQDSHVIKRLSFHKKVCGHFRFPHLVMGKDECYEDLLRLLEELELLVRVWRRRTEHPYTAHLRSEAKAKVESVSGEKLVEGEDYNQSDYEYDGSEDDDTCPYSGVSTPNEALTKKKFCQSVKIFQRIFDDSKQLETVQRTVLRMKKYVFRLVFQVFMETLPTDTANRLPQELWEKIWKYTQNGYFRYTGSLPLEEDTSYYKAGQRTSKSSIGLWKAEQERIRELFGAVGNLHIALFEILFKNPFYLHHLMVDDWESGGSEGNMLKVMRMLWWKHFSMVSQKFSRLRQLDAYMGSQEEPIPGTPSLFQKVEKGIFTIKDVPTELNMKHKNDLTTCQTGNIIVSMEHCSLFAIVDHEMDAKGEDYFLVLDVCDATTGKVVFKVKTGLKYSHFQIELAKFAIRRLGKTGWRRNLCLTQDRISVLYCDNSSKTSMVKVWSHKFETGGTSTKVVDLEDPLIDELVFEISEDQKKIPELKSSIYHSSDKIVVCFQNPFRKETVLNVYDGSSGELLLNIDWPEEDLMMTSFKNNRTVLVNNTSGSILFFSTNSGETIMSLPFSNLNEGSQSYGPWTGFFDAGPGVDEFAVIRSDNSKFQLYSYDSSNEMSKPSLEFSGTINDTYKLGSECLTTAKLKDGTIFFNRRTHLLQDLPIEEVDCYHEVCALSLRDQSCCPIITMCSSSPYLGLTKYNELSPKHFDPKFKFSDYLQSTVVETFDPSKRPLFFINASSFGIFLELGKSVKIFDFDHDDRSVLIEEEQENEAQERRREAEEAKRMKLKQEMDRKAQEKREKIAREKKEAEDLYVDSETKVRGRVDEWRGTYGFLRSRGRARRLGRIFFHRSNVDGEEKRRFFRKGLELEYNLVKGRDPGTFQAVKVVVATREGAKEATNDDLETEGQEEEEEAEENGAASNEGEAEAKERGVQEDGSEVKDEERSPGQGT